MTKALQYRKKSLLKDMMDQIEWRQNDLILFSKGHALGAILQDLDEFAANPSNFSLAKASQFFTCLLAVDAELLTWYDQVLQESPSPPFWRGQVALAHGNNGYDVSFASLQLAHLLLDYWALRLIIGVTLDMLCEKLILLSPVLAKAVADSPQNTPSHSPSSAHDSPAMQLYHLAKVVRKCQTEYAQPRQIALGTTIMDSLPYCMDVNNGISSSQKCLFGARVALFLLQKFPSDKLKGYEKIYMDLSANKGINWASGVGSTMQNWDAEVKT
jgi:hypothetical protein